MPKLLLFIITLLGLTSMTSANTLQKKDFYIESCFDKQHLFIREIKLKANKNVNKPAPVLLIHGARVPAIGSFDLPVAGGSLAEELAKAGIDTYLLDLRGYGQSTRPTAMSQPAAQSTPLIRTDSAVADIACAINHIMQLSASSKVNLLGWATGGHWSAAYATKYPATVNKLVIYNSLYGTTQNHPILGKGSFLDDPAHSGQLNPHIGGYQLNTQESLFPAWDNSITVEDKNLWRDPLVSQAYAQAALASDPQSYNHTPPQFRSPNGAMADSFELAIGKRQWQAKDLTMPTLVIFSQNDFWSRIEDALAIINEAPNAQLVEIPKATHFVHLDRNEHGRKIFVDNVIDFLTIN
jgi:Lysophospholipase